MHRTCVIRLAWYPEDPRVKKQVLALLEKDFQVDVLCLKSNRKQTLIERSKKLRVYRLPIIKVRSDSFFKYFFFHSLSLLIFFFAINGLFFLRRYKSIQIHTLPDFLAFAAIIPKIFGAKIVVDFHEPTPELILTKFPFSKSHFIYKFSIFIEQFVVIFSNLSITVTNALKNKMIERGADKDKIKVVTNVIDDSIFKEPNNDYVKQNSEFIIITHGAIEERYGHEVVIRAINILKGKYPNIIFKIAGEGLFIDKLKEITVELSCEKNVIFLGFLSMPDLMSNLNKADAGIIAMYKTPYSELIDTNKMYEFIAIKKPILHSRLLPVEENFDDACFLYFEPGNPQELAKCIEKLYLNPELRNELVKNSLSQYETLKWSLAKLNFQAMIENLHV